MDNVVLFGADSARSRAYFSLMQAEGLKPGACILLAPPGASRPQPTETQLFDNATPLAEQAAAAGVPVTEVPCADINSSEAVAALSACDQALVVFSGPAGTLVKAPLFASGKTFLHVHPGKLPQYRGSTTIYYSLLTEEKIWVSALILDPQIDRGPVVDVMEAEVPQDRSLLDQVYDPLMRARLMVRVLRRYQDSGRIESFPQPGGEGQTYFVIHPVLKHIAIQSRAGRVSKSG